jgi:transposase-like protein
MERLLKRVQKRRSFAKDFKRQIVKDFESGGYSVLELSRLHKIHPQVIYNWIYKYSTVNEKGYRVVEMKESSQAKVKALEARVKQLEQAIGRKQIQIDYLEKMIEIAEEELNISIKKNSDTPQSSGSANIIKR